MNMDALVKEFQSRNLSIRRVEKAPMRPAEQGCEMALAEIAQPKNTDLGGPLLPVHASQSSHRGLH